jgi:hypothetical protein
LGHNDDNGRDMLVLQFVIPLSSEFRQSRRSWCFLPGLIKNPYGEMAGFGRILMKPNTHSVMPLMRYGLRIPPGPSLGAAGLVPGRSFVLGGPVFGPPCLLLTRSGDSLGCSRCLSPWRTMGEMTVLAPD